MVIEIIVGSVVARVPVGADVATLTRVAQALKAASSVSGVGAKVLIALRPVDFRKGMDGLVALVRETLGADLLAA